MKQLAMTLILALLFTTFTFAQKDVPTGPTTTMEFEESQFDFGTIDEGEKVSHLFTFTNTGDMPLVIKDAKGSCGCTVPQWPKEPIAPGEQGQILVEFNSKGKSGAQNKRVTLTCNTNPAQTFVNMKGEVKKLDKEEDKIASYLPLAKEKGTDKTAKEPFNQDCFAIFPNPTADILKLDFKDHLGEKANIMIMNTSGQILKSEVVQKIAEEVIEFNVQDYPTGTYYVKIQIGNEGVSTKCFVVAN